MSEELWGAVDSYIAGHLVAEDGDLDAALTASEAAGLPPASITPAQGKLLELLARLTAAKNVLEIGTLGGYSTIWLARALPSGGRVLTLELDPRYAEVARENLDRAGLADVVDIRVGRALESLAQLHAERAGPFDLIFIDADKQSNPAYLEWSLKLARAGSLIVADNVVRAGAILAADGQDPKLGDGGIQGLRRFYELLGSDSRLSATALQTVTGKGHDGFALALVLEPAG